MRICGFEIVKSKPNTRVDEVVWNRHGRGPSRIGDLSPDDLRLELALVHSLASNRACYYIREGDVRQQLHRRCYQDLPTEPTYRNNPPEEPL